MTFYDFKQKTAEVIKNKFFKYSKFSSKHWFLDSLLVSVLTVIVCELFCRGSVLETGLFMVLSLPAAIMNIMIVMTLMMIPFMLKKKLYWKYFIPAFWITLAIINSVMYSFRLMPFNFTDILLIPSTFTVFPIYLKIWQMVLIVLLVVFVIYVLVYIYRHTPKCERRLKRGLYLFLIMLGASLMYYSFASGIGILNNRIPGLTNKYNHNGFVYCFTSSAIDTGMREPEDYSAAELTHILKDINSNNKDVPTKANIIFLQLESFFDVNKLKGISFSENPMPVFTELLENYSHGYLNVPTFSAGTANTEFEVLTGMNIDFFGIGEYPYETVVEDTVTESLAFCLSKDGYMTHAIHNNSASFYDRNIIYSNLGFDTFTSIEYMYNVKRNSLSWSKDSSLIPAINDCLDSSDKLDLIYTVGVQTHGSYPDDKVDKENKISVSGVDDESLKNSLEYYVNELREVDEALGVLISDLKLRKEPTVLVVFGDHMPGFEVEDSELINDNKYQTEYVLWSNFDRDLIIKDLEAYQLYAYVLDRLNIEGTELSKLHQSYNYKETEEYMSAFELLQYDMVFGEHIATDGVSYEPTKLKMGIKEIALKEVNAVADMIYIHGDNFNEFTAVFINDKKADTKFINSKNLTVSDVKIKKGDKITLSQIDTNNNILSTSNELIY